jgi:ankyrin repeat protein
MKRSIARMLLLISLALVLPSLAAAGRAIDGDFWRICEEGSAAEVQAAIQGGADVNELWYVQHLSPKQKENLTSEDLNEPWFLQHTPLHSAARHNPDPEVIEVLLKAGAHVNARDEKGMTPLHRAARYNPNPKIITVLLKAGANVNEKDDKGISPLHRSAFGNPNPEIITVILKAGAEVNAVSKNGFTPLHYAARGTPNPEVITLLLKAGADAGARDNRRYRPIDWAARNKHLKDTPELETLRSASK